MEKYTWDKTDLLRNLIQDSARWWSESLEVLATQLFQES